MDKHSIMLGGHFPCEAAVGFRRQGPHRCPAFPMRPAQSDRCPLGAPFARHAIRDEAIAAPPR